MKFWFTLESALYHKLEVRIQIHSIFTEKNSCFKTSEDQPERGLHETRKVRNVKS